MQELWERIERWLATNAPELHAALQPGASDAEINDAEAALGISFPADVRASFAIHDGQNTDAPWLWAGWELLSLARIRSEWGVWKELLDAGSFDEDETDAAPGVRSEWWNAAWIPLTYDGAGNHACLDLAPAEGGNVGQIIEMWHDSSDRPLIAPSYRAWLTAFADDLEAGLLKVNTEYGTLERD